MSQVVREWHWRRAAELPPAVIEAVVDDGERYVVRCPICGDAHRHGVGEPGVTMVRLSHCDRQRAEPELYLMVRLTEDRADGQFATDEDSLLWHNRWMRRGIG